MTSEETWPDNDLQYLGRCPICKSLNRNAIFEELEDWAFRAAPGRWRMNACLDCDSLYLDPRPTENSIGRAYKKYYTHTSDSEDTILVSSKLAVRIKQAMKRGYYGMKYGHKTTIVEMLFSLPYFLIRAKALDADLAIRHLNKSASSNKRLLDVGSGSGAFLRLAAKLGYQPFGLDPDPKAVDAGRRAGIEISLGGLPVTSFAANYFEHVTLSHVIEHLHDPIASLREILRILEPGGRLWMAFPNSNANGIEVFGKYWRGLEAPRHLVLPSEGTLDAELDNLGFTNMKHYDHPPCGTFFAESSLAQRSGLDPYDKKVISALRSYESNRLAKFLDRQGRLHRDRNEILIVTAEKPVDQVIVAP